MNQSKSTVEPDYTILKADSMDITDFSGTEPSSAILGKTNQCKTMKCHDTRKKGWYN